MPNEIKDIDIILQELDLMVINIHNIAHIKSRTKDTYREIEQKICKRFFSKIDPITLTSKSDRIVRMLDSINKKLLNDIFYPELFDEEIKALKVLKYILEHK